MKVHELLAESKSEALVKQRDVLDFLVSIAIKYLEAPAATKKDATEVARITDTFWDESVDEVTSAIRRLVDGDVPFNKGMYEMYDAADAAVENIGLNMAQHYRDTSNHPPGYVAPPSIKFDIDEVPQKAVEGLRSVIPALEAVFAANSKKPKSKSAVKRIS